MVLAYGVDKEPVGQDTYEGNGRQGYDYCRGRAQPEPAHKIIQAVGRQHEKARMGHVDDTGVAEDEREAYRQEGIYTSRHQRPDYDLLNHGVSSREESKTRRG